VVERALRVGGKYVVEPLNPQSTKHRGRVGILRKLRHDYVGVAHRASLTFIDGKGPHGVVDVVNLREITDAEESALETGNWPPPSPRTLDDEAREKARPSSLTQTRFSQEDSSRRPPRADVQALWNAAKKLDDPSLTTDSSTEYLFKHVFPAAKVDVGKLAMPGVARWLPSYSEMPCTWWGSPRMADIYRLAVRAYEPNGVLGSLCAIACAEAVGVKTGQPINRQITKWPRPWRTDGLLLADEVGLAVLQGRVPETLKAIFIADHALNFLITCATWSVPAGSSNAGMGVIGLASGAHVEDLASVRWPQGVLAVYVPHKVGVDTRAALKRLCRVLGPGVAVTDMAGVLVRAVKARSAAL
jgi:hypothetical protein